MRKQDYELIANTIDFWKDVQDANVGEQIAYALAEQFKQNNPRFDRDKFLTACGIKD